MRALAPVFLYLFGFAALGIVLRALGWLPAERVRRLNGFALNVALPALLVVSLYRSPPLDPGLLMLPVASWLTIAVGCVVGWLVLVKALRLRAVLAGSLFLPSLMGNTTFFGFPAASALLGSAGLLRAIFYDQLANGIFFGTVGVAIAQQAGAGLRMPMRDVFKRVLAFPPLWGLLAGFMSKAVSLPDPLVFALDGLGAVTVPFFLVGLGASLRIVGWRRTLPLALSVSAVKLVILPVIGYAIARGLSLAPMDVQVATMQAAMPSGLFTVSLAIAYGLDEELVVTTVATCTLLSALTLPLWAWILGLV